MVTASHSLGNLNEVRNFVNQVFCDRHQLLCDAFPLTQELLKRKGRPCGVYFCLHGPRASKLTAIWETERNIATYRP